MDQTTVTLNASIPDLHHSQASSPTIATLFRLALVSGVESAVGLHLRRGAPVNGRDAYGRTPLILAATKGHTAVCKLLLEAGADCSLRDNRGCDAHLTACSQGHQKVADVIETFVAAASHKRVAYCDNGDDVGVAQATFIVTVRSGADTSLEATQPLALTNMRPNAPAVASTQIWQAEEKFSSGLAASVAASDFLTLSLGQLNVEISSALPLSAETIETASGWEAEDDVIVGAGDMRLENAASSLDHAMATHRAVTSDADWLDVEIDFVDLPHAWTKVLADNFDAVSAARTLFAASIHAGCIARHEIEDFASHTPFGVQDELLTKKMLLVLGDAGVVVQDEPALPWPAGSYHADFEDSSYSESTVAAALAFLDDLSSATCDVNFFITEASRRSIVPSLVIERELFYNHRIALQAALAAALGHPAVSSVLVEWANRLEAGTLLLQDLTLLGADCFRVNPLTANSASAELPLAHDDTVEGAAVNEAVQHVASRFRQVARMNDGPSKLLATKQLLHDLSLTNSRIIELVESVMKAEGFKRNPLLRSEVTALGQQRLKVDDVVRTIAEQSAAAFAIYEAKRNHIFDVNLRLVTWQARRMGRASLPFSDLVQEGCIGLLRAIERYDTGRGTRFGTYAIWWIRQSMRRALQDQGRTIRVPVHVLERCDKLRRASAIIRTRVGREPKLDELAARSGETTAWIERFAGSEIETVELDEILEDSETDDIHMLPQGAIDDSDQVILEALQQADLRRCLLDGMRQLKAREQRVLSLRFGINDGIAHTLEEIGQIFGVTRERIRQLEHKALNRMRYALPRHFEAINR